MKKTTLMAAVLAAAATCVYAEAGPHGGRMLDIEPTNAEFFINEERHVEIRFYNEDKTETPPGDHIVSIVAEAPTGRTRLMFERTGDALVSTTALPEGDGYLVVVQLRTTAEARPKNFRIPLQLETCADCQRAEYACTCEGHGADAGHAH